MELNGAYIIRDTLPKFEWKILSETRMIAGHRCRKATTVIMDSVVVIAFYTDDIPLRSGPESFGGLPGMILGLAIPKMYTTWFATNVISDSYRTDLEQKLKEKKGKTYNKSSLYELFYSNERFKKIGHSFFYRITI